MIVIGAIDWFLTVQKCDIRMDSASPKFSMLRNAIGIPCDLIVVIIVLVNVSLASDDEGESTGDIFSKMKLDS
jgi:hypothetical protein